MNYRREFEARLYLLGVLLFMFCLNTSMAQGNCDWVGKVNSNSIFPTAREKEYFDCLKNFETQHLKLISDQQTYKQNLSRQNADLKVKKDSKQAAIANRDSVKIAQYTKEVESVSATVKSLDSTLVVTNSQINESKMLLLASYDRVLKYFKDEMPPSATNEKIKEYTDKKEKLKQMN